MEKQIENLLSQITLEEKVSLLAGADLWHTVPVTRLGIPAMKVTDGPNGARGAEGTMGPSSVCFPCGVALAATWNPALVERIGNALADEVKAKGAHILLAPTVNIHRSPIAGRDFECYSEDPFLTSRMAVAYIKGLQNKGVGACIKHFVCNDSEFERNSMSSEIAERPLREIYLYPFMVAVQEAKPWAVMSAYNKVNGTYCSENPYLLQNILKEEWGFDGIVMSDWMGSYSPAAAAGGLDLEMPGPARWLGKGVLEAVRSGQLSESVVDDKVRRILRTLFRVGAFDHPELQPEQGLDRPEHRALVREAASEAIVLLKNTKRLLPLDPARIRSIALIGAGGREASIIGGGSAAVTPHYVISPLEAIQQRADPTVQVHYALGQSLHRSVPVLDMHWLRAKDGRSAGLTTELFDNTDLEGAPKRVTLADCGEITWSDRFIEGVDPNKFSARLTGILTPPGSGVYKFSAFGSGILKLSIDEILVIDNWDKPPAEDSSPWEHHEYSGEIELIANHPYEMTIEFSYQGKNPWRMTRIGCLPPIPADLMDKAVELATQCEVAIIFAGNTNEWESEGFDRPDMDLPCSQNILVGRVAAANPNTIVVLNTGSPLNMPWIDQVAAVMQAWFTGQESGNAVADVLFGIVNPSGKLPNTFPKRIEDTPAYINYPGENGRVYYGEGLFVGYRYYDKKDIEPLFPFGFGLSYTTFAYHNLRLSASQYSPGDIIQASLDVQNTGERAGKEIVQLYLRDVKSSLVRPLKELKAFAKVELQPGETRTVTFNLGQDVLAFYDDRPKAWLTEPGVFQVLVGSSARDIHLTAGFEWKSGSSTASAPTARFHTGLVIQILLENPSANAVLEKHIPEMIHAPELGMAMGMSLEDIAKYVPQFLTRELLDRINADLAKIK